MKVVINRCFGGFGLSEEAFDLLLQKKGVAFEKGDNKKFGLTHYYQKDHVGSDDHYISQYDYIRNRSDEDLVAVVEELGVGTASGEYAELKIVEIPDNVNYIVEEYDGLEHVAEAHRTWG